MSIGALARVLAICTLLALLHSPGAAVAQETPSPCDWKATQATADSWDLSGRLGSTREAFEARFGQPKAGNKSESFPEYEIPGCGTVMASWSTEGYLVSLSIFSPREDPDKSFEKADPADWTIGAAQAIATNFAPIDSTFDDQGLQPPPMAYWYKIGHSEALLNQVPASAWEYADNTPSYGDFLMTLRIVDESKDIYWIDLDMGFEPEDAPAT